jgi:transmembrane protein EpsG
MITVAIFNCIVVFLASLAKSKKSVYWLKLSFIFIFFFLALRYNYGNDYMSYLKIFNDTRGIEYGPSVEIGWQILNLLFKPFGFFFMIAFLAAFNCIISYRFIVKYIPPSYYWLAVFIYVFTPASMLILSSAMRQSIAVTIFLFSIDYLYKKDVVRYILCIVLASFFHTSALVLIPVCLLVLMNYKVNNVMAVILFFAYVISFVFINQLSELISVISKLFFSNYSVYLGNHSVKIGTGLGFLFGLSVYALIVYYSRFQNDRRSLLFILAIVGYLLTPLGFINTMASRIDLYFYMFLMAAMTILLTDIKDARLRYFVLFGYIPITLLSFYNFFHNPVWAESYSTYQTVFSALKIY